MKPLMLSPMTDAAMIDELGTDAHLLVCSDEWLEQERKATARQMEELAGELRSILLTQRIKQRLQQRNKVAVQHLLRNDSGDITDVIIRLMDLPDALQSMADPIDTLDQVNQAAQVVGWQRDGYDLPASAALRQENPE